VKAIKVRAPQPAKIQSNSPKQAAS
jgi:hypothetical protein